MRIVAALARGVAWLRESLLTLPIAVDCGRSERACRGGQYAQRSVLVAVNAGQSQVCSLGWSDSGVRGVRE